MLTTAQEDKIEAAQQLMRDYALAPEICIAGKTPTEDDMRDCGCWRCLEFFRLRAVEARRGVPDWAHD